MTIGVQPVDDNGKVFVNVLKPGPTQTLKLAQASTAYTTKKVMRVVFSKQGYLAIKSSGSATVTDMYVPADKPELFKVEASDKVCVLMTSGGTAYVNAMG